MPTKPTQKREIQRLVGKLQRDPFLVDELLSAGDENKRKEILVSKGYLGKEDEPDREAIKREMLELAGFSPTLPGPGNRPVEWVGAIATAAAGAAAAACTGD
jgi:hypothetical protein